MLDNREILITYRPITWCVVICDLMKMLVTDKNASCAFDALQVTEGLPDWLTNQDVRLTIIRPEFASQFGQGGYTLPVIPRKNEIAVHRIRGVLAMNWVFMPPDEYFEKKPMRCNCLLITWFTYTKKKPVGSNLHVLYYLIDEECLLSIVWVGSNYLLLATNFR